MLSFVYTQYHVQFRPFKDINGNDFVIIYAFFLTITSEGHFSIGQIKMLNETSLILSTAFLSSPDPDSQERCTIYGHFSKSAMKLVLYNCWRRDMYKVETSKSLYTACHIHFPI